MCARLAAEAGEPAPRTQIRPAETVEQLARGRARVSVDDEARDVDRLHEALRPLLEEAVYVGNHRLRVDVLLVDVHRAPVVGDVPLVAEGLRLAARPGDHLLHQLLEPVGCTGFHGQLDHPRHVRFHGASSRVAGIYPQRARLVTVVSTAIWIVAAFLANGLV